VVIYISKSKVGNPDDLMRVRHELSTLDVEVVEFFGGSYIGKEIAKADILIVVPPKVGTGNIKVGKGQYDEVNNFKNEDHIYIVTRISDKDNEIDFEQVEYWDIYKGSDENWQNNYGTLVSDDCPFELYDEFSDVYEIELKADKTPLYIPDSDMEDVDPSITGCKPMLGAIKYLKP